MKGYIVLALTVLAGVLLSCNAFGYYLLNLSAPENVSEVAGNFNFVGTDGWNYSLSAVAQDVQHCVDLYDVGLDSRFRSVIRGNIPGLWPQSYSENCSNHILFEFACGNEINRTLNANGVAGLKGSLGIDDAAFNRSGLIFSTAAWPTIFDKFKAPKLADCSDGRLLWNCSSDVNCSNGRQWSIYCDGQNVVMDAITSAFCIAPGTNSGCGMNVVKSVAVDCGGKGCNMSSGECFTSRPSEPCVTQLDGTACVDASGNGGVCSGGSCYVDQLKLGLVLYAPFDDGTANDKSGNQNNGVPQNGTYLCPECGIRNSGAAQFDGYNDYINLTNSSKASSSLPAGTANRTMCVWAKPNSVTGGTTAAYGNPSTNNAMYINMPSGTLTLNGGGHGNDISFTNFWNIGVWKHACLVYNGTNASLYGNGQNVVLLTAKPWSLVRSKAYIGRYVNDGMYWNGTIDEVRIYNRTLNDSEIFRLYNMSCPIACYSDADCVPNMFCTNAGRCDAKCLGEVLHFSFNDSTQPVPDLSGRGYQGIVNGAAWTAGGKVGGAYVFNGTNTNITARYFPRLSNYTMSAWINPAVLPQGNRGIIYDGYGTAGWGIFSDAAGNLVSRISNGAAASNLNVDLFNAQYYTGWHHIVLTDNSTTRKFYRDGLLVYSGTNSLVNKEYGANLSIGTSGSTGVFNGSIDDVRIFNYALNDSQVFNLYCPSLNVTCNSDSDCDDGNPETADHCRIVGCDKKCVRGRLVTYVTYAGSYINIMTYDPATTQKSLVYSSTTSKSMPKGYGDILIWYEGNSEFWYYNLTDGSRHMLSKDNSNAVYGSRNNHDISRNWIVWTNSSEGDIVMCDLRLNGQQGGCLENDRRSIIYDRSGSMPYDSDFSIYDDTLAMINTTGSYKNKITVCNLSLNGHDGGCLAGDHKIVYTLSNSIAVEGLSLHADILTFTYGGCGTGCDIYMLNLSSGVTTPITIDNGGYLHNRYSNIIDKGIIVWNHEDDSIPFSWVYMCNLSLNGQQGGCLGTDAKIIADSTDALGNTHAYGSEIVWDGCDAVRMCSTEKNGQLGGCVDTAQKIFVDGNLCLATDGSAEQSYIFRS